MKRLAIACALVITCGAGAAYAKSYLVASWFEGGNQMCRYDNGTVLNMGARICPLSIG